MQVVSARDPVPGVPLVTFTLRPEYREGHKDEFLIAEHLRQRGWIVPAYKMARGAEVPPSPWVANGVQMQTLSRVRAGHAVRTLNRGGVGGCTAGHPEAADALRSC